jgi:hypothetical protein
MENSKGLLMIEPKSQKCDDETIIDTITMRMAGALKHAAHGISYDGWHTCACGALSSCTELLVLLDTFEVPTNSLAVHYLACHRSEVPFTEIDKVERLPYELAVPGPAMIKRPKAGG